MTCPHCGADNPMKNGWNCNTRKFKCSNKECRKQFSETAARFAARVDVNAPYTKSDLPPHPNGCVKCGKAIRGGYRKVYNGKQHFVCPKPDEEPRGRFLLFQSALTGALIR